MCTRNYIQDCRQSKGWVIYKTLRVIASSKEDELTKKYISNRIKYPQHDLKQDEAIRQINIGAEDKLLSINNQVFYYGNYSFENSDHDWYCYKCHEIGKVFKCSSCWRVYHNNCAKFTGDQCTICEKINLPQPPIRGQLILKEKINEILKQILHKLSDEAKQINTLSVIEGNFYNTVPIKEIKKLIYNSSINFNVLESKINQRIYKSFFEFYYDCEDICHNLLVLYGPKGRITKLIEKWFESITREIEFVTECLTCYKSFYDKSDKVNFCQPCVPPHDIAFVKFKGFPLWPCKIYSESDKKVQVWFFAGNFTRCYVPRKSVYSIKDAVKILSTKVQINKSTKIYQKAIADYDIYMDKIDNSYYKVANLINSQNGIIHAEDENNAELPPQNFQSAMGETWNGTVTTINNNIIQNPITNGNSKSMDGTSNLSFTFNGDSMNNSISNSTDLDSQNISTPIKAESRNDKTHVYTPKNFVNLTTTINNSMEKSKFAKKTTKQFATEVDVKEENKILKRKLKEAEDKLIELRQSMKECYTKEYVENLNLEYKNSLGEIKRKTWCRICDNEAFYYCCWNTFYCSLDCQIKHWWTDHKNQCFRKKHKKNFTNEVKLA